MPDALADDGGLGAIEDPVDCRGVVLGVYEHEPISHPRHRVGQFLGRHARRGSVVEREARPYLTEVRDMVGVSRLW